MDPVVVIGAGPYGLSAAAHLRAAGHDVVVHGDVMGFWRDQMPKGMLLRSLPEGSSIGDPADRLTLQDYERASAPVGKPVPLEAFIRYGEWFADHLSSPVDPRRVLRVVPSRGQGFRLELEDGTVEQAARVVVATGIAPFASRPEPFRSLPPELVSHAADHKDLSVFAGRSVAVVGAGQSALESAALLHEAGATVEVLSRRPAVQWLRRGTGSRLHKALHDPRNPLRPVLFPSSDIGPVGISYVVDKPVLYRSIPTRGQKDRLIRRAVRPAGALWLRSRLDDVPITTGVNVTSVSEDGDRVKLSCSDGQVRGVDHVLLGTGYHIDVTKYPFLTPEVTGRLVRIDGYPSLKRGFESSVPGLHFVGAPAVHDFGPLLRFVAGTRYAGRHLADAVTRGRVSP